MANNKAQYTSLIFQALLNVDSGSLAFLAKLFPIGAFTKETFPKNISLEQGVLISLNISPFASDNLKNFQLPPEIIKSNEFFYILDILTRDFFLAQEIINSCWGGIDLMQELLIQPQVVHLKSLINEQFPEESIRTIDFLKWLLPLSEEQHGIIHSWDSVKTEPIKPLTIISRTDINHLLTLFDKDQNLNCSTNEYQLATKLKKFLQENNLELLSTLTTPIVAKIISEIYNKNNISLDTIKNRIKGVFPSGCPGLKDYEKQKQKNKTMKELKEVLQSMEFHAFS